MERIESLTSTYAGPNRRQRVMRVAEAMSTGGFSLLSEIKYPTINELREIEAKGFQQDEVQSYINELEQGTPAEVRAAAMLRGSFNELLGKIEEH